MTAVTKDIGDVGYWSGMAAFAATIAYVVVQLLQVGGLLRFPLDEILIYGTSLCIVVPFMLVMLSLHYLTPRGGEGRSRGAAHPSAEPRIARRPGA